MKTMIYTVVDTEINGDAWTVRVTYDREEAEAAGRSEYYHLTERELKKRVISIEGYEVDADGKTAEEAWSDYLDEGNCEDPAFYEEITSAWKE